VLEFLQEAWTNMADHPKFADISDAINAGLENLNKWYRKIDDTDVYFICLGRRLICCQLMRWTENFAALDPKWKLAYAREKWDKHYFNAGVKRLEKVV
jgi:hypothetical protein